MQRRVAGVPMTSFVVASVLVAALKAYAAVGAGVSVLFLTVGIDRCAPAARGAYAFRPLLAPGIVLLWPLVLARWAAITAARRGGG
jgi:hypothetical protein